MSWWGTHPRRSKAEARSLVHPAACRACIYYARVADVDQRYVPEDVRYEADQERVAKALARVRKRCSRCGNPKPARGEIQVPKDGSAIYTVTL